MIELLSGELFAAADSIPSLCASLAKTALRAGSRPVETAVLSGADAVAEAAPAWRDIERRGGAATPFQSLAVARACAEAHLARGETPHIVMALERGEPVLILPGVVGRLMGLRTLRFLGDPLIQYGDAICAQARPEHFRAAWGALAASAAADIALLRKVRADARIAPFLSGAARTVVEQEAPFIDLARGKGLNRRDARELRRCRRRLTEHGELRLVIERGAAARRPAADALAMKRAWLTARGLTSSVIGDTAWEEALLSLAGREGKAARLTAISLRAGEHVAAVEIGFEHGDRWHAYLGAMSPRFAKFAPGRVQMAETVDRLRRDGAAVYDLLAPADGYKLDLATGTVKVRDYLAPLGWRGRLAGSLAGLAAPLRACLGWMPAGLRRRLAGAARV